MVGERTEFDVCATHRCQVVHAVNLTVRTEEGGREGTCDVMPTFLTEACSELHRGWRAWVECPIPLKCQLEIGKNNNNPFTFPKLCAFW